MGSQRVRHNLVTKHPHIIPSFSPFLGGLCNVRDLGLIPGSGRSPGEENSYPLQYSGLENSMDHIAHGLAESDMTEGLSLMGKKKEKTEALEGDKRRLEGPAHHSSSGGPQVGVCVSGCPGQPPALQMTQSPDSCPRLSSGDRRGTSRGGHRVPQQGTRLMGCCPHCLQESYVSFRPKQAPKSKWLFLRFCFLISKIGN